MQAILTHAASALPQRPRAVLAAVTLSIALAAVAPAHAQRQACVQGDLVGQLLSAEAERIGSTVETLKEAGEISRYIAVINEEPPPAGPAETLLILVHPRLLVARVFLVHDGSVCERYLIGPELHRKAWNAARGTDT